MGHTDGQEKSCGLARERCRASRHASRSVAVEPNSAYGFSLYRCQLDHVGT